MTATKLAQAGYIGFEPTEIAPGSKSPQDSILFQIGSPSGRKTRDHGSHHGLLGACYLDTHGSRVCKQMQKLRTSTYRRP